MSAKPGVNVVDDDSGAARPAVAPEPRKKPLPRRTAQLTVQKEPTKVAGKKAAIPKRQALRQKRSSAFREAVLAAAVPVDAMFQALFGDDENDEYDSVIKQARALDPTLAREMEKKRAATAATVEEVCDSSDG